MVLAAVLAVGVGPIARAGDDSASLPSRIAWQVALEREGFSPGLIDGCLGRKTDLATREFQRLRGLSPTGKLDAPTVGMLGLDAERALTLYTVTPSDFDDIGHVPGNWIEKSRLTKLGHEDVLAALAEKFHCSRGLLARLNPGRDLGRVKPGDVLTVPRVQDASRSTRGQLLEIDVGEKVMRVRAADDRVVALFHCSIAKHREKVPSGEAKVVVITENPSYTFDPKMWPEVKGVDRKLLIPPGPRNPVGRCWIGLSLPGYGIHGSPNPELIGKTGSHGCFRLTNWDALRLGKMLRVGTRVRFVAQPALASGTHAR